MNNIATTGTISQSNIARQTGDEEALPLRKNNELERIGFFMVRSLLTRKDCERLLAALDNANGAGRRDSLQISEVATLAHSEQLRHIVRPHVPKEPRLVRAIYFNKGPDANWAVAWHQDLTIAVRER